MTAPLHPRGTLLDRLEPVGFGVACRLGLDAGCGLVGASGMEVS